MEPLLKTRPPHPIAEILWLAWFGNAVVAILTGWPGTVAPEQVTEVQSLTSVVLVSFFVLELGGWLRARGKDWSATLSEVVWWRIPWWPVRWLLGTGLAIAVLVLVSRFAGFVLLVWLGGHFAFREFRSRPSVGRSYIGRNIHSDVEEARRRAQAEAERGGPE